MLLQSRCRVEIGDCKFWNEKNILKTIQTDERLRQAQCLSRKGWCWTSAAKARKSRSWLIELVSRTSRKRQEPEPGVPRTECQRPRARAKRASTTTVGKASQGNATQRKPFGFWATVAPVALFVCASASPGSVDFRWIETSGSLSCLARDVPGAECPRGHRSLIDNQGLRLGLAITSGFSESLRCKRRPRASVDRGSAGEC